MKLYTRYAGILYFQHIIKPLFFGGRPGPAAVDEATGLFRRFAAVLNEHLRGRKYILGGMLTIADFAIGVTLPYAEKAHIPVKEFPEIERWHGRLNELPAWREPFPKAVAVAA
jgi:glutathione S-transferase